MKTGISIVCMAAVLAAFARAGEPAPARAPWSLVREAAVDARGVTLASLLSDDQKTNAPDVVVFPSPAVGKFDLFTRAQIADAVSKAAPELTVTNWTGAPRIRITRRTRSIAEADLRTLLTAAIGKEHVADGELELEFMRPPGNVVVADEPVELKILDFPGSGLGQSLVLRFELRTASETFGPWQSSVRAHLWRDVLVASRSLSRGDALSDADLATERQDLLKVRDAVPVSRKGDGTYEITQSVEPGTVITSRLVRRRPVVLRGKVVAALVQDGPLNITVKVEVLEDGVPGQTVRVRNVQSKREFQGKVQNEQTVLVTL